MTDPKAPFGYFPGEREAIAKVLEYGGTFGYGNLISHLQEAWSKRLQDQGIPKPAADMGAWKIKAYSDEIDTLRSELAALKERCELAESVCREVKGMSQWGEIIAREATGQTNWNVLMGKLEAWRSTQGKGANK